MHKEEFTADNIGDLTGNKTFRPQDVSPLVVSPPFWSPSRFAPQP